MALLAHWIQNRNPRALYWVATPDSAFAQLRSFSQAVYAFNRPNVNLPENFTHASWEQAWEEGGRLAKQERIAVFIDEFTYLLETTPAIAGKLQNFWDHRLKNCSRFAQAEFGSNQFSAHRSDRIQSCPRQKFGERCFDDFINNSPLSCRY